MFPAAALDPDLIDSCIRPLKAVGYATGIMVPSDLASACLESSQNGSFTGSSCRELSTFLTLTEQTGAFSDIGVRADVASLIDWMGSKTRLHWTAVDFPIDSLDALPKGSFRLILVDASSVPSH